MQSKFKSESYAIPSGQNGCPTTDEVRRDAPRDIGQLPPAIEESIVGVLTCPPAPNETHLVSAQRREHALRQILGCLSVTQAMTLGRRLDADRDTDRVAVALRRFTAERRQRIRTFLADARRRAALAHSNSKE